MSKQQAVYELPVIDSYRNSGYMLPVFSLKTLLKFLVPSDDIPILVEILAPLLHTQETVSIALHNHKLGKLSNVDFDKIKLIRPSPPVNISHLFPAKNMGQCVADFLSFRVIKEEEHLLFIFPIPFLFAASKKAFLEDEVYSLTDLQDDAIIPKEYYCYSWKIYADYPELPEFLVILLSLSTLMEKNLTKDAMLKMMQTYFSEEYLKPFPMLRQYLYKNGGTSTTFVTKNLLEVLENKLIDWGAPISTVSQNKNKEISEWANIPDNSKEKLMAVPLIIMQLWEKYVNLAKSVETTKSYIKLTKNNMEQKYGFNTSETVGLICPPHVEATPLNEFAQLTLFTKLENSSTYLYNNFFEGDLSEVVKEVIESATITDMEDIFKDSDITNAEIRLFVGHGSSINLATLYDKYFTFLNKKEKETFSNGYQNYLNKLRTKLVAAFATI